mgnify:FL=1
MKQVDTKQRILSESLRLFSENGYDAVSVAEIASAVGIKAPSLYKHYKSKRDIFDSILKKMSEADGIYADENDMPNVDDDYNNVSLESIKTFSVAMFKHWTDDEFAARFRRMLSLERFKNTEMAELYKSYISSGPLDYMKEVFAGMNYSENDAGQLALSFYGPMFMLYTVYDESENKKEIVSQAEMHINKFIDDLREKSL